MDTQEEVARFEAERQALAMIDHLDIGSVCDGGATDTGRPFVMELVKGVPITDYCDLNKLSPRERLDLFLQIGHDGNVATTRKRNRRLGSGGRSALAIVTGGFNPRPASRAWP